MSDTNTITVACVGAGYFSQYHYDAWYRNPNTHVIACADEALEKAERTNADNAFTSITAMLNEKTPDILDIITPPPSHLEIIRAAVKHDIKIIVCQKPFCLSIDEAKTAVALAGAANIHLVIHENFRFQPWFRAMKKAIDENLVGRVLQLTFRLRTGDGQGENAYLDRQPYFRTMPKLLMHETGVHYIDTFKYLLGGAETVYADLRTLNPVIQGEDAGFVLLGYEDGKRALLDGNRLLDHDAENSRLTFGEAILEGTLGEIKLHGNGELTLRHSGSASRRVLLEAKSWPGFAGDCVYALQEHLVSALLHETPLENSAEDYLRIMAQVDLIYRSATTGTRLQVN